MSLNCTTDKYEALYARWLVNPGTLLDVAGYVPGDRLLDLCGGTGAVSREALRRGADPSTIVLVDLNPRCPDERIEQVRGDADMPWVTFRCPEKSLDLIVIRQAAAYLWFRLTMLHWWQSRLADGGKMVFNLFTKPKWSFKTYKFNDRRFFEASWYIGRQVWHMQATPSIGIDFTRFTWVAPEELRSLLEVFFQVEVIEDGKSQRWVCSKR